MEYSYRIFGLSIKSEIKLPAFDFDSMGPHDVSIRFGRVPLRLPNAISRNVFYEANKNDFIFKVSSILSIRVKDGSEIIIEPVKEALESEVLVFLLGTAFGALLHQRGYLPLHGSSIKTKEGAVVFTGKSASGKSTLAADLVIKGFKILDDDITAISRNENNQFVVHPGIPQIKLWKDVLANLKHFKNCTKVRPHIEKYQIQLNDSFQCKSERLVKILVLQAENKTTFSSETVSGAEKFSLLKSNTYRTQYVHSLDLKSHNFQLITELANQTPIYKVTRPISPLRIHELSDYVLDNFINN
jgi:hypothetical protein